MLNKIKTVIFNNENKNVPLLSVKNLNDLKYFNAAKKIFSCIENQNNYYKLMFVGGCVRKLIKEQEIDDIDIATNVDPKEIKKILVKNNIKFLETGISHGTITVLINDFKFEITTLRKDVSTDGRHADVQFIPDWEIDAKRRDFTINAIYSNLRGEVYDPLEGVKDLREGIIQFIGEPSIRIEEDYLRIIRYIRFFTQYSKHPHDQEVVRIIKKNLGNFIKVSKERSLDELFKILKLKNFNNLFKDEFSCFIILSIFPQLKYFERLNLLNKISNKLSFKIDKILLLSILLIDNTDNTEFFLYKYNLSNEIKKRILFIKNSFKTYSLEYLLNNKNLMKLCYLNSKARIIDLLIFLAFNYPKKIEKIEKLIIFVENINMPEFPIDANFLILQFNFSKDKNLGDALKKLELNWIENNFKIEKNKIKSILKLK